MLNLPPASKHEIEGLLVEAMSLRARVLDASVTLAHAGLVSPEAIAEIRSGQGTLGTATDLSQLGVLLGAAWPRIHNKTHITLAEIQRCGVLGGALHAALGEREQGKPTRESAELRSRAFTLLIHVYDENRRALSYLRWREGDVEEIAPSLFAHGGGHRKPEPATATATAPTAPTGPAAPSAGTAAAQDGPFTQEPEA